MECVAVEARRELGSASLSHACFKILAGIGLERDSENPSWIAASARAKQKICPLREHLGFASTWACSKRQIARGLRSGCQRVWLKY